MDMNEFIEKKLNNYAEHIIKGSSKPDELALGEMVFYMALRRLINGKATMQDLGMMDAINDTLEEKGLIASGQIFYK